VSMPQLMGGKATSDAGLGRDVVQLLTGSFRGCEAGSPVFAGD